MSATTGDLLGTIVAATERIVEVRAREVSISDLEKRCATADRRPRGAAFESALRLSAAPRVIAECTALRVDLAVPFHLQPDTPWRGCI